MDSDNAANIAPINMYSAKFPGFVAVITGAAQGMGAVTAWLSVQQSAQFILLGL